MYVLQPGTYQIFIMVARFFLIFDFQPANSLAHLGLQNDNLSPNSCISPPSSS